MRPLLLLGLAVATGGCDLFGDCSFNTVPTREQRLEATRVSSLPDTVVVAFVETPLFPVPGDPPVYPAARFSAGRDSVHVSGLLSTRKESPDLAARLDVRGDTVFVSLDAPLVRLGCSPGPYPGEGFLQIDLPRGVTVRAIVPVPQGPPRIATPLPPVSRPTLLA